MVAAVPLGAARYDGHSGIALPFWIAGFGLAMCMIGTAFVRTKEKADQHTLLAALRWGVYGTSVLVLGTSAIACWTLFEGDEAASLYGCVLAGLISGLFVGYITEYATSDAYPPTQSIAKAADTGPATVIIQGLSVAMLSTIGPVVAVVLAVIISYELCGGYGVSIAATSMLSTLGMTLATDAYGPVADNAGGIAEMAKCAPETRKRTDALDSLGNTTAATGKGFAISSAALTTLSLITEFTSRLDMAHVDLLDVYVLSGVFIGCMLPFVLCAQTMRAVGKSAGSVILEVRRQLKEKPGIMDYTEEPDPARCVQLVTRAALQEMVQPALMTLGVPLVLGHLLGYYSLAGLLSGSIVAGFLLAVAFANAGGAWDNAKKLIESGALGPLRSKGTPAHDAAVCGDTVGDPMKDVSGPSIDILCKLMALFSLLLSPILTDDRSKWWIGVILLVVFLVIGVVITYVNEKFGPKTASFGDMIDEEGEKEEKKEETPAKDEEPVVVAEEEKKEDRA
jgi:H(+)-translocating pyrophosphatase